MFRLLIYIDFSKDRDSIFLWRNHVYLNNNVPLSLDQNIVKTFYQVNIWRNIITKEQFNDPVWKPPDSKNSFLLCQSTFLVNTKFFYRSSW